MWRRSMFFLSGPTSNSAELSTNLTISRSDDYMNLHVYDFTNHIFRELIFAQAAVLWTLADQRLGRGAPSKRFPCVEYSRGVWALMVAYVHLRSQLRRIPRR